MLQLMPEEGFANLGGRRAVITGASSGIGRAIARELANAGAAVLIHYGHAERDSEVEQFVAELKHTGRQAESIRWKFAEATDYQAFLDRCRDVMTAWDIWVNNAGADLLTGDASQLAYGDKLRRLMDVDVRSTMMLTKLVGAQMKCAGQGVILNLGWDQADRGMEGDSGELFSAAKNAIMGATRSFAVSFAPEVRVNCIAPGWIQTAWGRHASPAWQERVQRETPLRRWGQPEDIAKLARFLVSHDAAYLTGQVINANGGAVR